MKFRKDPMETFLRLVGDMGMEGGRGNYADDGTVMDFVKSRYVNEGFLPKLQDHVQEKILFKRDKI